MLLLALTAVAFALLAPTPARAARSTTAVHAQSAGEWLGLINGLRASRGLAPLQVSGEQTGLAQQRAEINAANNQLAHTPSLPAGVSENWTNLGENVGAGGSVDTIWNAFLSSPRHFANLTNPGFTHIGIGVASNGSTQYVVHRFMALGAPAPAPAPAPEPVAQPDPPVIAAPPPTRPPVVVTQPPRPPVTQAPVIVTTTVPVVTTPPTTAAPEPPPVVPAPAQPERVSALLEALYRVDR